MVGFGGAAMKAQLTFCVSGGVAFFLYFLTVSLFQKHKKYLKNIWLLHLFVLLFMQNVTTPRCVSRFFPSLGEQQRNDRL